MKTIFYDVRIILLVLFSNLFKISKILNKDYILVTASDSQHFIYLENLIKNYEVKKSYFSKLVIFNLGMSKNQIEELSQHSFVELRNFNFDDYPAHYSKRLQSHNNKIGGFAWKPEMIELVLKDFKCNVIWFDSATRFNFKIIFFKLYLHHYGFISFHSTGLIKDWTHTDVLKELGIYKNEKILNSRNLMGGIVGFDYNNEKAVNLLKKWNKLASDELLIFPKNSSTSNHRHDQSLLSILYWREYRNSLPIMNKYFGVKIQNWPNKILFFFDDRNNIKEKLLEKFIFYSTTTNKRCRVIFLFNTESLKKIPIYLILSKKVILFIHDSEEAKILKKFVLKKLLINKYIDKDVDEQFIKSKTLTLNLETISEIVSNEFESANGR